MNICSLTRPEAEIFTIEYIMFSLGLRIGTKCHAIFLYYGKSHKQEQIVSLILLIISYLMHSFHTIFANTFKNEVKKKTNKKKTVKRFWNSALTRNPLSC